MDITNKEVAKKLGISETTLSFILNNKPGISEKTKKRVIDDIYRNGYEEIFQKRKAALSSNICFCTFKQEVSMLETSPFFLLLMGDIDQHAQKYGYNTIIRYINSSSSIVDQVSGLYSMDLSGIMLFATEMHDKDIQLFRSLSIPMIVLDNDFSRYKLDSIVINNEIGTYQAVEHLVQLGHQKIGYLKSRVRINSFDEREAGYRKALQTFGLKLENRYIFELEYGDEASFQSCMKLLSSSPDLPTAFVSDDDLISAGVVRALRAHGLSVPGDISVIGFNDRPLCGEITPALSTIQVPKEAFGSIGVELLVRRISEGKSRKTAFPDYQKISIGTNLLERDSTGPHITKKQ